MIVLTAIAALAVCTLPPGWDAVDARHLRYIVLGEVHGTKAGPATLTRIACALSRRSERLLVALEQNATDDAALQNI